MLDVVNSLIRNNVYTHSDGSTLTCAMVLKKNTNTQFLGSFEKSRKARDIDTGSDRGVSNTAEGKRRE